METAEGDRRETPGVSIALAGRTVFLDHAGALFWPREGLLAVADLHLEKGTACARRGQLLPPWDSAQTLDRLEALVRRHAPSVVLALGDSFHDGGGAARLDPAQAARVRALTSATHFVWVRGNHDPDPPAGLGGVCAEVWDTGGVVFRHAAAGRGCDVSGHLHPKMRVATRTGGITRRCFVTDGCRVLLPALGAYAGGLDVRAPAILRLFPSGARAFVLGQDRLFGFAV